DRNRSHWSTSKTPSYTKSVSWQHHLHFLRWIDSPPLFNPFGLNQMKHLTLTPKKKAINGV
ncbi:hypothetical protein, partial [Escherichia coli]